MDLRTIAPTLGLAAAALSAQAVEVGNVTIGGFVDSIFAYEKNSEADDSEIGFSAEAELQIGAKIGDRVSAQIDIEFYGSDFNDDEAGTQVVNVEQAYVAYGVTDTVTLQMGKWEGLIGYEAWDATGLYRVGKSPVFDLNGVLVEGLDVNIAATEQLTLDFYIANGVYVEDQVNDDALGLGANATYAAESFTIDLDIGYDMEATGTGDNTDPLLGVNLSGDFSGVENLILFGDFAFRAYEANDQMGIMIGGNYGFTDTVSGTLMISYVDNNSENDKDTTMEVAAAVLTNPTGDSNFGINYELAYDSYAEGYTGDATADSNDITVSIEFLAILP